MESFKLKNPRKGTEMKWKIFQNEPHLESFKLKNPRKGTEIGIKPTTLSSIPVFQIKESPEGDWNELVKYLEATIARPFKLKNPRKGTEILEGVNKKVDEESFKLKNPRKGTEIKRTRTVAGR